MAKFNQATAEAYTRDSEIRIKIWRLGSPDYDTAFISRTNAEILRQQITISLLQLDCEKANMRVKEERDKLELMVKSSGLENEKPPGTL